MICIGGTRTIEEPDLFLVPVINISCLGQSERDCTGLIHLSRPGS